MSHSPTRSKLEVQNFTEHNTVLRLKLNSQHVVIARLELRELREMSNECKVFFLNNIFLRKRFLRIVFCVFVGHIRHLLHLPLNCVLE